MIVKAKYYKEIEVTDEISKEEIDRIPLYGMPDRFDCMADQIDNDKPLEFVSWSYVDDKYYEPRRTNKNKLIIVNIIIPIIFAIIFGISYGIHKQDIWSGIMCSCLCITIWLVIQAIINWIKITMMKGDNNV